MTNLGDAFKITNVSLLLDLFFTKERSCDSKTRGNNKLLYASVLVVNLKRKMSMSGAFKLICKVLELPLRAKGWETLF